VSDDTTPSAAVRWAALGGVVGPTAFVSAWVAGAALTDVAYSPTEDAISRLAAVGADTRPLMTAGFVAFGVGVAVHAWALRRTVDGPAWVAAVVAGLATLAVAGLPLDRSDRVDAWHGVAAGVGYVAVAATPLLAARALRRSGHRRLGGLGVTAGTLSATALALTVTGTSAGFFQRLGLTVADAWIIASGIAVATGRLTRR
jgi:hypothetical membrane protein